MISLFDLKDLAKIRLRDSETLLKNNRYNGSVYIGGYTIELLLKYKICEFFNLKVGYPETKSDLYFYNSDYNNMLIAGSILSDLKVLKTHNLNDLLKSPERNIKLNIYFHWNGMKYLEYYYEV